MDIVKTIEENKKFVEYLAKQHFYKSRVSNFFDLDDIVSYAYVGLLEAINSYDETKNVKFRTFAKKRINGSIVDSIWGHQGKRKYLKENDFFNLSYEELTEGINDPLDETDKTELNVIEKDILSFVKDYIDKEMNEKEKSIITYIYYCDLKLKEISEIMNISIGRISQIHKKALNKIKNELKTEGIYSLL
jgi:RNA polymerase sigma factor for flagellar operon FliA